MEAKPIHQLVSETANQSSPGSSKLVLLKKPEIRILPGQLRIMQGVNADLRTLFRCVLEGTARWPIYLWGSPGRGKTCAALAFLDYVPWGGVRVEGEPPNQKNILDPIGGRYWTAEQLVTELIEKRRDEKLIAGCSVAVLDELGIREKATDVHYTVVKEFADARQGKPTIYISNLEPNQVATVYDDRIASRILCGVWFHLEGLDRRML